MIKIELSVRTLQFIVALASFSFCQGQQFVRTNEPGETADGIKVLIDCSACDLNDLKQNIQFVTYVRDRKDADVYILVTGIETGAGIEYSYFISGQGKFSGQMDTIRFSISAAQTIVDTKNSQVRMIKAALVPFIIKTPIAEDLEISVREQPTEVSTRNNWNNWVFDVGLSGYYSWDQNYTDKSLWSNFSVTKVNQTIKTEWTFTGKSFGSTYDYDGYVYETENEEVSIDGLLVGALSDHWSIGFQSNALYSTYSNYRLSLSFFPSIEFNIFPYSKATRRQLSFLYGIGGTRNEYIGTTIFDQESELLYSQRLSIAFKLVERWGNVSLGVQGRSYFHDMNYNRLTLSTDTRFRIFKGFFLKGLGGISIIHDQVNLSAAGIEYEQVLLQQKEILSAYYYWLQLGVSFTFGDIYNGIVNPRFTQLF